MKSNVTLRGAGPNATIITTTGGSCLYGGAVCFNPNTTNYMNNPQNTTSWTAGFTKGTTVITVGNASALAVGSVVLLDQTNDSATDLYPGLWYCMVEPTCTVSSASGGGDGGGTRTGRLHIHEAVVTATNGNNVTISPPLSSDFSASRTPQVTWPSTTTTGAGVEELSINASAAMNDVFEMNNSTNSWVKHVRSINPSRSHVLLQYSVFNTVRDSYFFRSQFQNSTSYGIEWQSGSFNLIENNIFQWITAPLIVNGGIGNVIGYNFTINQPFSPAPSVMFAGLWGHAGGTDYTLFEGNDTAGINSDIEHGMIYFTTLFRNYLWGNENNKTGATNSVTASPINRFFNVLGNVMGVTGYHTVYQCTTASCPSPDLAIYLIGAGYNDGTTGPPDDPRVAASMFRWGNWDTVTSTADNTSGDTTGTRWNSGEVPSGIGGSFANPVPTSNTLPSSMYLSAKPSFLKSSDPWPFYGPDVTQPAPLSNTGGHAAHNPAAQCYYNIMGGTNTGTTVLPFTCTYPLP